MTNTTLKFRTLGGAVLASTLLLSGCSSVPDAINPVEWYKSTVDLFDSENGGSGETAETENKGLSGDTEGRKAAEAKAQSFPKVSDVPDAPKATSDAEQARAREGLIADREQRRYASAPIPRQSEDGNAPAPAPMIAKTQPPPAASPAVPVTPAPMATAKAPPPVAKTQPAQPTMSAKAPPPPTSVGETYRNKLAQKFKPMGAAQPDMGAMPKRPKLMAPANANLARVDDPLATVVISSDGVVSQGSQTGGDQPVYVTASSGGSASSSAAMKRRGGSAYSGAQGTVKVATILFPNGSARLSAREVKILQQVSAILKEKGGRIRVVGHASSRTRDMDLVAHKMTNFQVSADRADAVARALIRIGVAPELISVVARSDADPQYYEIMPSGEAANRRAEIYLDS